MQLLQHFFLQRVREHSGLLRTFFFANIKLVLHLLVTKSTGGPVDRLHDTAANLYSALPCPEVILQTDFNDCK